MLPSLPSFLWASCLVMFTFSNIFFLHFFFCFSYFYFYFSFVRTTLKKKILLTTNPPPPSLFSTSNPRGSNNRLSKKTFNLKKK